MMEERIDSEVVDWARRVPVDQIPSILAFLSARLLTEGRSSSSCEHNGESARDAENLLAAGELAECLGVPESWSGPRSAPAGYQVSGLADTSDSN
jgi:hypothetical protein